MTLQDGVSSSANGTRTCAKIDTPLTQRRSGDVPVTAKARISGFRRIPQKHSARMISRLCRAKPSPISVSGATLALIVAGAQRTVESTCSRGGRDGKDFPQYQGDHAGENSAAIIDRCNHADLGDFLLFSLAHRRDAGIP